MPVNPAVIELSNLNGANGFKVSGSMPTTRIGTSGSGVGDINGDGFADVIIGSPGDGSGGVSYVVFGKAAGFAADINTSTLNGVTGFRINGENTSGSGVSVSTAGDVNGDGIDDLFIGAPSAGPNGSASGASYVVFGKAAGFAATFDLSTLNGSNGFQINGEAAGDRNGSSIAAAGDVNGDGFGDIIVGASAAAPNGNESGASYVIFGKSSGLSGNLELSGLDGTNGFQLSGALGSLSGFSVSTAGDINNDGFDDIIVGATRVFSNGDSKGASYIVFGKASGFATNIDLFTLDGTTGFEITGETEYDSSGYSVSGIGDVNGDGFDDVVIGSPGADSNGDLSGTSYVVFGKASGFAATFSLAGLNGTQGFKIKGETADDGCGTSVSAAGDVNGDGYADLIVGAHRAGANGNESGASYVVFGKATGFPSEVNLSLLDGTAGFKIVGEAAFNFSGGLVSSAGDVNGDGFDDILVGATGANSAFGATYIIFGRATASLNRTFTNASEVIGGGDGDDTLKGEGGNDRMNAGDGDDIVDGGAENDDIDGGAGDDKVNGGSGNDIVGGGSGDDEVSGSSGNDNLNGGSGNDLIMGGSGNDILSGNSGADELRGGSGNDIYYVDTFDTIFEAVESGTDSIRSSTTYSIANLSNIERLGFTGSANANGTGNAIANILTGNSGFNTLDGAAGSDQLIGGKGRDTLIGGTQSDRFKFGIGDSGQTAATMDRISDFEKGGVGVGDRFDFSSILTIGGTDDAPSAGTASIDQITGIATFAAGSGVSMTDALNDIANILALGGDNAGDCALFRVNNAGAFHVFVSDGVAGVTANDVLVQLSNITSIGSISLSGGDLTILT